MTATNSSIISGKNAALQRMRKNLVIFEEQFGPVPDVIRAIDQKIDQSYASHPIPSRQDEVALTYSFLHSLEAHQTLDNYMTRQTEIDVNMRAILIKWMAEVIQWFHLPDEVFSLSVVYVDLFLARRNIPKNHMQRLGVSAIFLADKMVNDTTIPIHQMATLLRGKVEDRIKEIIGQEMRICCALDFHLLCVTPIDFLGIFDKLDTKRPDKSRDILHLAARIAEIGYLTYSSWQFSPSMIASASWIAAHYIRERRCGKNSVQLSEFLNPGAAVGQYWPDALAILTGYGIQQLGSCVMLLTVGYETVMSQRDPPVIATRKINL